MKEQELLIALTWGPDTEVLKLIPQFSAKELMAIRNDSFLNPLMMASKNGSLKIVNALIDAGMDVNAISAEGTALILAAKRDHPGVVNALLNAGAKTELKDSTDKTALMYATGEQVVALINTAMNTLYSIPKKKEESTLTWAFNYAYSMLPSLPSLPSWPVSTAPKVVHFEEESSSSDEGNDDLGEEIERKSGRKSNKRSYG